MKGDVKFPEALRETNKALGAAMRAHGEKPSEINRAADTGAKDEGALRFIVWSETRTYAKNNGGEWYSLPNRFAVGEWEDLEIAR